MNRTEGRAHGRNKARRVALVAFSYFENDPRIVRAARALAGRGYLVDFICLTDDRKNPMPREEGVRFFRFPMSRERGGSARYLMRYGAFFAWASALIAARHLRRRYDLVYVNNLPNFLVFSAALPKLSGAKVLLDVHDPAPELLSSIHSGAPPHWLLRFTRAEERVSLRFAHQIVTVNEPMRERLLEIRPAAPVAVVMNLPDVDRFRGTASVPPEEGTQRLVYCGTIARRHGLDLVVEAMASLATEFPTLRLTLIGEGPDVEPVLTLARERGVLDRVEYHGVVHPDEVPQVLAGATAGLSPLREDQFGALVFSMKVPEYIAAGLPVVCSRTKTMSHYYADDELTFFEPNDVCDLARAMREVLRDPQGARQRSARAMSKLDELDWSAQRGVLLETVDSLLGNVEPPAMPGSAHETTHVA